MPHATPLHWSASYICGEVVVDDVQLLRRVFQEEAVPHGFVANVVVHAQAVGVVNGQAALVVVVERVLRHDAVLHIVAAVVEVERWRAPTPTRSTSPSTPCRRH